MNQEEIQDWRSRFAPNMIGQAPIFLKVFETIERVCDTDCNVLVTGESGTGKELVARAIHVSSPRSQKPFVALNCAAIPRELMESEIFGHVKGAFTGALERRDGRFAIADGGTLFLDEVGEMDLDLQGKFLRVIQEKEFTPVGETKTRKVDVRLVAATNRDLSQQCKDGKFREDLFYRLNVIPINLPALKERIADVPMLCGYFIERANQRYGRMVDGMCEEAMQILCTHEWPGNVREMENLIERLVILKKDGLIDVSDLPPELSNSPAEQLLPENIFPSEGVNLKGILEQIEIKLIKQALNRSGGNKAKAAELLQLKRTTLVERLKKLGITN